MAHRAFVMLLLLGAAARAETNFGWQFPSPGNSTHRIFIDGYAPVLFIPVPHFYIGLGPALAVDVASSFAKQTQVGFTTEIGGYF